MSDKDRRLTFKKKEEEKKEKYEKKLFVVA